MAHTITLDDEQYQVLKSVVIDIVLDHAHRMNKDMPTKHPLDRLTSLVEAVRYPAISKGMQLGDMEGNMKSRCVFDLKLGDQIIDEDETYVVSGVVRDGRSVHVYIEGDEYSSGDSRVYDKMVYVCVLEGDE